MSSLQVLQAAAVWQALVMAPVHLQVRLVHCTYRQWQMEGSLQRRVLTTALVRLVLAVAPVYHQVAKALEGGKRGKGREGSAGEQGSVRSGECSTSGALASARRRDGCGSSMQRSMSAT